LTTIVRSIFASGSAVASRGRHIRSIFTGPPALLESLSHTLRIDDAVLRFRIIKVLPGTPPAPDSPPPVLVTSGAPAAPSAAPANPEAFHDDE
jgi:hypothetical protein